jgi:hypothetical protein
VLRLDREELNTLALALLKVHEALHGEAKNAVVVDASIRKRKGHTEYIVEVEADGVDYEIVVNCREGRRKCSASLYVDGLWRAQCSEYCVGPLGVAINKILAEHLNKVFTNIKGEVFMVKEE